MKRLFVVENKKARVEFKMDNVSIGQIQGMYDQLCKSGLGWETKEFKTEYEEENDCCYGAWNRPIDDLKE